MTIELHVFKIGQTNPFPFVRYSSKSLENENRRKRIFSFFRERRNQFYCKVIEPESGKVRVL